MAGKPHLIQIQKREKPAPGNPAFVAAPGAEHVGKSDEIMFVTRGTHATIFIPNADKFLDGEGSTVVIEAAPGHQTRTFQIAAAAPSGKEFPYAVYCEDDNDFAEGGSTPRFIIE